MRKLFFIFVLFILCNAIGIAQNKTGKGYKTGYIINGKAKIYYEEKGKGTPLIMIHSGFSDRRMWDNQFKFFSKNYRVIRYDVRNHGLTKSDSDYYFDYNDLNLIMEKLHIDKAIIMGLSMGGYIALDFALTYPDKVIALIPVSTGISGYVPKDKEWLDFYKFLNEAFEKDDFKEASEVFLRYWFDGPKRTPEQVDKKIRKKLAKTLYSTFKKYKPEVRPQRLKPPAIDRLSEIKLPVLTIYGDNDIQGIIDLANKIEKDIPGAKKVVVNNAAHMLNMEYPDEFNEIVSNFLNTVLSNLSPVQAEDLIRKNFKNPKFLILDVRTPEEFSSEHLANAINIDVKSSDFSDRINRFNKKYTYLVYCKGGVRSLSAIDKMRQNGFKKLYNLSGGLMKWKSENKNMEIK